MHICRDLPFSFPKIYSNKKNFGFANCFFFLSHVLEWIINISRASGDVGPDDHPAFLKFWENKGGGAISPDSTNFTRNK